MRARNLKLFLGGSIVAAVPLLLAGCGQGANTAASSETPASETAAAASDTGEATGSAAAVDDAAAPAVTNVVAVPAAPQATDSSVVAPLVDAAAIARSIDGRFGIQRVRHGDGWAWLQHGNIIRTASADGKQVAYFRNGSDNPFFVQNGDHAYSYSGTSVTHAYDRGRPEKLDTSDRDTGNKLADKARRDRKDAQHVAQAHPEPKPSPSPSPTSSHDTSDHSSHGDRNGRNDGDGSGPTGPMHGTSTPTPAPTPSPTHTRRGGHERDTD